MAVIGWLKYQMHVTKMVLFCRWSESGWSSLGHDFKFFYFNVCVFTCVGCAGVSLWGSEYNLDCWSSGAFQFWLESTFLYSLELHHIGLSNWPMRSQGSAYLHLLSHCCLGYQHRCLHTPSFQYESKDPNLCLLVRQSQLRHLPSLIHVVLIN